MCEEAVFHNLLHTLLSQHLSPNHPYFSVTLFPYVFLEPNCMFTWSHVCTGTLTAASDQAVYENQSYALLSFRDSAFFWFPTTTSFFPEGHTDMNATLTASSMRRTFQSPITIRIRLLKSNGQTPFHALPVTLQHGYHCHFLSYRPFKHCLLWSDKEPDLNNDVK